MLHPSFLNQQIYYFVAVQALDLHSHQQEYALYLEANVVHQVQIDSMDCFCNYD